MPKRAAELELAFESAQDPGFRARATAEYRRIRGWLSGRIDWNTADILDFGCGEGVAAASIAARHPGARVVGLDIAPVSITRLGQMFQRQVSLPLPENLQFIQPGAKPLGLEGQFDLVYAWSVFEHIALDTMAATFSTVRNMLKPGGTLFLYSDPLYFSPKGSHLYRYIKDPWHHLIMPLGMLRDHVVSGQTSETALREWQQFLDLNRATAGDILHVAACGGLRLLREQRLQQATEIPARLAGVYQHENLTTTALQAMFEAGPPG